jgi:hypothetical protein
MSRVGVVRPVISLVGQVANLPKKHGMAGWKRWKRWKPAHVKKAHAFRLDFACSPIYSKIPLDILSSFWHTPASLAATQKTCVEGFPGGWGQRRDDIPNGGIGMRLRNLALTVLFGLGVCGIASAEESGNWFTNLFTRRTEKTETAKADANKSEPAKSEPKSALPDDRIIKAQADWQRRQDIIVRLLELAEAAGDDELRQKAMTLDRRAWDAYTAAVGPSRTSQQPIGTVNMNDIRAAEKNAKGGR